MKTYIINAYALDGRCWALSINCETLEQAEACIESLGLMVKPGGVGELIETKD